MRRRLAGLLLPAILLVALVLPATSAVAAPAETTTLLLATEAVEGEELPGPEPSEADAEGNEAAPVPYEANFLWGAGVGLFFLMVLGALALGAMYFLLVVRPQREND